LEKLKERALGKLGYKRSIILECFTKKQGGRVWFRFILVNELSGSLRGRGICLLAE